MSALRHMHEFVAPSVAEVEDTELDAEARAAVKGLNDEQRAAVLAVLNEAAVGLMTGATIVGVSTPGEETKSSDDSKRMESWDKVVEVLGPESDVAMDVLTLMYRKMIEPNRARLLRGSLLTSAISTLESLMGDLVREYFLHNPGAMSDEPSFSLRQLQEFDSMQQAAYEAATIRAEAVTGSDLADWSKWLKNYPDISIETHCHNWAALYEAFQRRHVLVHNGGRVSRRYHQKVERVVGSSEEIGSLLPVDQEYLDSAFDEIETIGNLLGANVWAKSLPDQEAVIVHGLYLRTYDLMLEARWPAVKSICSFAVKGDADADLLTIHRVNELLARRELGEDISGALQAWDASALDLRYQFAKECLDGDLDILNERIPRMLDSERLSWAEVEEWPLLAAFRADGRFTELARRFQNSGAEAGKFPGEPGDGSVSTAGR